MTNIEIMMKHCSDNGLLNLNLGNSILKAMEEYKEQEIAKLNKHNVSQQRELLLQFSSHLNTYKGMEEIRFDFMVCDFSFQRFSCMRSCVI